MRGCDRRISYQNVKVIKFPNHTYIGMSLELDLLDAVIDRAESSEHRERVPSREELEDVNRIVLEYIKKRKLLLYGGTAIDTVLKHKTGEGIYGPTKLPDYDFISNNNVYDAMTLANVLKEKGYRYVAVNQAQHGNTMRVKVNFAPEPSADITYYPSTVFNHVPHVEIDDIRYVSPEYMRIDFYKSFTNPNNYYRWLTKDEYLRYRKLVDAYPLKPLKMKYKKQSEEITSRIREMFDLLSPYRDFLVWTGIVAFNRYAQVMGTEQVPINYLEAYIPNAEEIAKEIIKNAGSKSYKLMEFSPLIDHYPAISMIVYKKHPILCLYNTSELRFIPTTSIKQKKFVSYHQLLLFFHIKILQSKIWKDTYYCKLAQNLLYRISHEREAYLNKHKLIGTEKGEPLSIFDFDFNNLPVSEVREIAIESFYKRADRFKYYPEKKIEEPIKDHKYAKMDGLPVAQ